jgi:hypothetical protein
MSVTVLDRVEWAVRAHFVDDDGTGENGTILNSDVFARAWRDVARELMAEVERRGLAPLAAESAPDVLRGITLRNEEER